MGQPDKPDTSVGGRLLIAAALSLALHTAILWGWHGAAPVRDPIAARVPRIDIRLVREPPATLLAGQTAVAPLPARRQPPVAQPTPRRPAAPSPVEAPTPIAPATTAPTAPAADLPAAPPVSPVVTAAPMATPPSTAPRRTSAVVDPGACAKPEYPRASLRDEEIGTVSLAFLIGADGTVLDSRVERSSGHRRLDEAARAALSLCRFSPATVDGRPEPAWARLDYVWRIE